jgi:restriction endonuclease Mrr
MARKGVPDRRPLLEKVMPSLAAKREETERAAREEHERLAQEHAEAVRRYEEEQEARNAEVRELRRGYEEGDPEAVERFIEAREVLEELEAGNNLITMDWQDFEMLVRDVFEKVFSDEGTEVNVTRASRDEGVDAVVVNPDPLKGGKTIVQAKRYRKAVPAAAVRELYGAMQSERAGRGILVTTAGAPTSSRGTRRSP